MIIGSKHACMEFGCICRLTNVGNSQFNLGKSRDEFKLEFKQGTWWTPITLRKEDTAHSSCMEEL